MSLQNNRCRISHLECLLKHWFTSFSCPKTTVFFSRDFFFFFTFISVFLTHPGAPFFLSLLYFWLVILCVSLTKSVVPDNQSDSHTNISFNLWLLVFHTHLKFYWKLFFDIFFPETSCHRINFEDLWHFELNSKRFGRIYAVLAGRIAKSSMRIELSLDNWFWLMQPK